MTDLTTTHLKCLLDQATPGPWVKAWDNKHVLFNPDTDRVVHVESSDDARNIELIAAAPLLAQEVIRLRDALGYLVEETLLAAENSDDAVVQKRVADAIKTAIAKIQGDHDE